MYGILLQSGRQVRVSEMRPALRHPFPPRDLSRLSLLRKLQHDLSVRRMKTLSVYRSVRLTKKQWETVLLALGDAQNSTDWESDKNERAYANRIQNVQDKIEEQLRAR